MNDGSGEEIVIDRASLAQGTSVFFFFFLLFFCRNRSKMNTFPLEGKLCLMTGGLGGIAVGVARLVLERGGRVMLADLRPEEEGEREAK